MTTVQKIRLMISSFADIKAAIEEKGGNISGVGYKHYANGVRTIYGGGAVEEYEYPKRGLIPVANLRTLVEWCGKVKEQVRQAIIGGGVSCDTSVPLSEYGNKIREITAAGVLRIVTEKELPACEIDDVINIQLEAVGGTEPYRWSVQYNSLPRGLTLSEDGIISGIASDNGWYKLIQISCTDSEGTTVTKAFGMLIQKRTVTFRSTSPLSYTYDGEPHAVTFECVETPNATATVRYGKNRDTEPPVDAGTYSISIFAVPSDKYSSGEQSFIMSIRTQKIYVTYASVQTYQYDPANVVPHAFEFSATETTPQWSPTVLYKPYADSNTSDYPSEETGYTTTVPSEVGEYRAAIMSDRNHSLFVEGDTWGKSCLFGKLIIKSDEAQPSRPPEQDRQSKR